MLGTKIRFDGRLDLVINNVPDEKQKTILKWVDSCNQGKVKPEPCKNFRNLISFIYKSNDNRIRVF